MDLAQGSEKQVDAPAIDAVASLEQTIVCETEIKRISDMRNQGWRIAKIVENHFGDDYCRIDGFLLHRRS